jgi:hypothetical protein
MLAAAGVLAALSACGIEPGPVVGHRQAQPDPGSAPLATASLKKTEAEYNPVALVENFLAAAAERPNKREDTLRSYMADPAWKAPAGDAEINVYRQLGISYTRVLAEVTVTVKLQRIGTLSYKDGLLKPIREDPANETFIAVEGTSGLLLKKVPQTQGLMMTDSALQNHFESRPVYFSDLSDRRLVPDYRYVSRSANDVEQARQLIEWMFAGPAPFLDGAVRTLPAEARPNKLPVVEENETRLVVDLPIPLDPAELTPLGHQLSATLAVNRISEIVITQRGQEARRQNNKTANEAPGARYAVVNEQVVRLRTPERGTQAPLIESFNHDVVWASFSRLEGAVVLAQRTGGQTRFFVGPVSGPKPLDLAGVEQAAWLDGGSKSALVLANRKLYDVTAEGPKVAELPGLPGPVVSFSVTHEGRIVLVTADGVLHIAALRRDEAGALRITTAQEIPTELAQVQHASFREPHSLVIAGITRDTRSLVLTSIWLDGSRQQSPPQVTYGPGQTISRLTGDPRTGTVFYEYGGEAFELLAARGDKLTPGSVAGPGTTPSPSASTGSNGVNAPISAPSFEG